MRSLSNPICLLLLLSLIYYFQAPVCLRNNAKSRCFQVHMYMCEHLFMTLSVFVSVMTAQTSDSTPAQLTDSDLRSSTACPFLTACPFVLSRIPWPALSHLLSLFRYIYAGHSCIHILI